MKDSKYSKVEDLLYSYPMLKVSVANLKLDLEEAVEELQLDMQSKDKVSSSKYDNAPNKEAANIVAQDRVKRIENSIRNKERTIKKIDNALTVLSEKDRKVIELYYFEKMMFEGVMNYLEISTSNVTFHKKNALSILQDVLLIEGEE
ncbi:sigma-70 RNA polymerase sigma factor region 4 domain-containing protein [Cellulosilyticum lentocellum]|uniref:Uncharacterized protein n=1 Tax=Cellulosilyticum lentocellum (strain ATCC 49066 / DSM 5427 / NCIMB 11756 / RHM5) TaxID=642492 RepID=F2JJ50_CELLD|nr:sigma-70 family RNA polymerase sigma factor [Cellulosilyticum lentocellum]ADZ83209.1 hypothetical protein Clole_1483 [Cellulosilyticum lentocellum DSM 5427]